MPIGGTGTQVMPNLIDQQYNQFPSLDPRSSRWGQNPAGPDGYLPPLSGTPNGFPPSSSGLERPKSPNAGGKQSKLTTVWTRVMDLAKRK